MLNLDAGQSTDVANHCFLLEDELRLFLLFFLVEFLAVVLVHLLHAQTDSVFENFEDFDPNEEAFFDYLCDVFCGLLSDMAGVDYCWFAVDHVEHVDETTHFVDFGYLSFVYLAHLERLYLRTIVLLLFTIAFTLSVSISVAISVSISISVSFSFLNILIFPVFLLGLRPLSILLLPISLHTIRIRSLSLLLLTVLLTMFPIS